jgi:pimeloyl-ACP methyl ester carboxylesterase
MASLKSRDGTSIGYSSIGEGPPVVLVDPAGAFRGFGLLTPLAEQLSPDFTAITYDRRGRGESGDTLPYAVDREVEDLAAIIDGPAGGSAFVYGFSSGAVLALWAAADGLAIRKLALLEPPLAFEPDPEDAKLGEEVAELVAAGRPGDAVMHFNRSIGVPEDMLVGMRDAPWWPALEKAAHTLVYDTRISAGFAVERLASIATPTLVVDSSASDERLHGWAEAAAEALPNGVHRTLPGEWHGVAPEIMAPEMREFYLADRPALSATGPPAGAWI